MAARKLLIVTALVETATGLMQVVSPTLVVAFLLGASRLPAERAGEIVPLDCIRYFGVL